MPKSSVSKATSPLELKGAAKATLQEEFGWPVEPKRAVICIPTGLTADLGGPLFENLLPGILSQPVELLILGKGSSAYGKMATELSQKQKHRVSIVPNDEKKIERMITGADIALFLSDSPDEEMVRHCLAAGTIPVAPKCKLLENYNPVQETGNSFLFDRLDPWHCFAALVRALETHVFPFDWKTIQKHCLESV
jgi:glycogen synthase